MRYIVQISFFDSSKTWDIEESFKTLKAAREYKSAMDNSVRYAQLFDKVKNCVVERWV